MCVGEDSLVSFVGEDGALGGLWSPGSPFQVPDPEILRITLPISQLPLSLLFSHCFSLFLTPSVGGMMRIEDVVKVRRKTWRFLFSLTQDYENKMRKISF